MAEPPPSDDRTALLAFCAAQRELTSLDDATAVPRKQHARAAATYRDLLRDQMADAKVACVPVVVNGKQKYVIAKPGNGGGGAPLTVEAVARALREATYDVRTADATASIEEWVERTLRDALSPPPEATGAAAVPMRVAVVVKPPPEATTTVAAHPAMASRIQETVTTLAATQAAARELREHGGERRKQLKALCKKTEGTVAEHLRAHDPEHGTRRVRLVQNDVETACYLRRKCTTRARKPTLQTALPAVRKAVRALREEAGMGGQPSYDGFRWLTSAATLERLARHLKESFAALEGERTKTRVVFTAA